MDVNFIVDKVDMVEFVQKYVELTQKGNDWWGHSPFNKNDMNPSFSITPSKKSYYDFSAGFGGDLVNFVEKIENVSFIEAMNILADFAGVKNTENIFYKKLDILKSIQKYKPVHKEEAVIKRKILSENVMDIYDDNPEKLQVWIDEGISFESLNKFKVKYDLFSDRIVMPIRDISGNIINICGRTCDEHFKQNKIPKYIYYHKLGTIDFFYGFSENLENIRASNEILLFEGAKSVMKADSWGIKNSVAILTNHINIHQIRLLMSLHVNIVLCLDKGVDVKKDNSFLRVASRSNVFYLEDNQNLLDDKDAPVDKGKEVFLRLYSNKKPM